MSLIDPNCEYPCRFFWTLPEGAPAYYPEYVIDENTEPGSDVLLGYDPNEMLFPNRHTYVLSTPSYKGLTDWLTVNNAHGFLLPSFEGGDDVLTEKGVYDIGAQVVMVKPSSRELTLDIRLTAENKQQRTCIRELFGYMFSHEHMTAVDCNEPTRYPSMFDTPNLFTLTYECLNCDGNFNRRHIDVAVVTVSGGDGFSVDSFTGLSTSITMFVPNPYFYTDEICLGFQEILENGNETGLPPEDQSIFNFVNGPGLVNGRIRYLGTARTPFIVSGTITNVFPGERWRLRGFVLVDETANTSAIAEFNHWDTFWMPVPDNPDSLDVFEFNTELRYFEINDGDMNDHFQANFEDLDWGRWQLIPGHVYRFVIRAITAEGRTVNIDDASFCFRNRYVGL